jgi:carboxylesterase
MSADRTTYRIAGGKIGVLLLHRLGGTPTEMRFVAHGLARAGYTVHCPQISGQTGGEIKSSTWQDWYAEAEEALLELHRTCDMVIVGGLSAGAILSLLLAARHPDKVQGTALFAPTLWLNGWLIPWYARLFRAVTHKGFANLIRFPNMEPHGIKDTRIRDFYRNALMREESSVAGLPSTPGGAVLEHRRLVRQVKREVGKVTQPALILHPREDDFADLSNACYLQRHLKGTVDMVVLDDSYHIVTVDRQRNVVVDRTVGFVERITAEIGDRAKSLATAMRSAGADAGTQASAA